VASPGGNRASRAEIQSAPGPSRPPRLDDLFLPAGDLAAHADSRACALRTQRRQTNAETNDITYTDVRGWGGKGELQKFIAWGLSQVDRSHVSCVAGDRAGKRVGEAGAPNAHAATATIMVLIVVFIGLLIK
jgi:hypothetical protein